MAKQPRYALTFAPEAVEHLDWIESKHHTLLQCAIHEQLCHTPAQETRNRKLLEQPAPFESTWELRCGPGNRFRVFYEVNEKSREVCVLGIGVKDRNRLYFGGEEFTS